MKNRMMRGVSARLALVAGVALSGGALAGGGPENVLLIIDPSSAESLYIGNYYKNARNIPDANVLYIDPDTANFQAFAGVKVDGLFGHLRNRRIDDHIDYIVVTPGNSFFVSAPGLVTDSCFPVGRFSMSSVWTLAHIKNDILPGGVPSTTPNQYYSSNTAQPLAFSSNTAWLNGSASTSPSAKRYFIGAMLGYSGSLGNTVPEILAMIDRSVAVDSTHPTGTFYFMDNQADPARNVRAPQYPAAVSAIQAMSGSAMTILGILPTGMNDCLGIMTGAADPLIAITPMTIKPGAFADHLTSYAGTFDNGSQTKMSQWISKGASGTSGTVEEPCNYLGKFVNPRLHVFYYRGMSLGESYFRTMAYIPFQGLLLGDPITRPFTYIPVISLDNPPAGPVSGTIVLTPSGVSPNPGFSIITFELLINGVLHSKVTAGNSFSVNTTKLPDGHNDIRIVGQDNTLVKSVGRYAGGITVNNFGRTSTLNLSTGSATLVQPVTAGLNASGGTVKEIRLMQGSRVVASRTSAGPVTIYGRALGSGVSSLVAEAEFTDGRIARSAPATLDVSTVSGAPALPAPVAFGYTKDVLRDGPCVVELPAMFDHDPSDVTFTLLSNPAQATVAGSGAWRVVTASASACGSDTMAFRVNTPAGPSSVVSVTLRYWPVPVACVPDFNGDGILNLADFGAFQTAFALQQIKADLNNDCVLNLADFGAFQTAFALGCQ